MMSKIFLRVSDQKLFIEVIGFELELVVNRTDNFCAEPNQNKLSRAMYSHHQKSATSYFNGIK